MSETTALKHDIERHIKICSDQANEIARLTKENEELETDKAAMHERLRQQSKEIEELKNATNEPNYFAWVDEPENCAESVDDLMDDAPIGGTMHVDPAFVDYLPPRWYLKTDDGIRGYWDTEKEGRSFFEKLQLASLNSQNKGEV